MKGLWRRLRGAAEPAQGEQEPRPDAQPGKEGASGGLAMPVDGAGAERVAAPLRAFPFDLVSDDPLIVHLLAAPGAVEIDQLEYDSPVVRWLKAAGVYMTVPLVSQGELIGLLNVERRRSEQEYSLDDQRLLKSLATQAAPALRVAQMAEQQQQAARERERVEQELRVARVIQETLLPAASPNLPGWRIEAFWQPAREVSGDFYDFISFPDGKTAFIAADVTGKGVPAALVMATARSLLRSAADRLVQPGVVLQRANNQLCPDIPAKMFVTCLYLLLDPTTGQAVFANAGHNLPVQRTRAGQVEETRARGMPLGLMPDMEYEEQTVQLSPGESLMIYSDGVTEAHNPQGEMFDFSRLAAALHQSEGDESPIAGLMDALADFVGSSGEQEDDVTLVWIKRLAVDGQPAAGGPPGEAGQWDGEQVYRFTTASVEGNERQVMEETVQWLAPHHLPTPLMERIKTAVAEAAMNAMEYGNHFRPELLTEVEVVALPGQVVVRITDQGGYQLAPQPETPNLEAKLAGRQSPRGWGLFLIHNMADEVNRFGDPKRHTIEMIFNTAWPAPAAARPLDAPGG